METTFLVNGYEVNAEYQESEINEIFLPLLKRCQSISEQKKQRVIVFLAAPPGAGKTTLLCFLEQLAHEHHISFQGIGLDGFHRYQDYLNILRCAWVIQDISPDHRYHQCHREAAEDRSYKLPLRSRYKASLGLLS